MNFNSDHNKRFFKQKEYAYTESINDLRDKEFSGKALSTDEKFALANFERYRLNILNSQKDEAQFHLHYRQIQVISSLGDWREFLKDEYSK